ncbi:MAG: hypothetical protein FJ086_01020 [Deltaproteobacteria bacterium]|nr:hypothetical protein [Deltaproteobacteria bacterium]
MAVPKGWAGQLKVDDEGRQGLALAPVARPDAGGVVLSRQPAPELPPGTTLPQAFVLLAAELTGGAPVEAVGPAEFFAVGGRSRQSPLGGERVGAGDGRGERGDRVRALDAGRGRAAAAVGRGDAVCPEGGVEGGPAHTGGSRYVPCGR